MPWALIIDVAIRLIMQCMENRQNRDEITGHLRNPGIREAWALRRALKQETTLRGRKLHHAVQAGMDHLVSMDDQGIGDLIDDAEEVRAEMILAANQPADSSVLPGEELQDELPNPVEH